MQSPVIRAPEAQRLLCCVLVYHAAYIADAAESMSFDRFIYNWYQTWSIDDGQRPAHHITCLACCLSDHSLPAPSVCFLQHFIQRAGPEILVRDLPPKQELLLALAPTPSQYALLQALMGILEANGRSLFRDIEVGRHWPGMRYTAFAMTMLRRPSA
jgi:hypothetical protein